MAEAQGPKVTVVCVRSGQAYPPVYVLRLRNMVARHLRRPHAFVCVTDAAQALDQSISALPLPDVSLAGWWCKLGLFKRGFLSGRILYMDLDVVIHGHLDRFALFGSDNTFSILRGFGGAKDVFNSSIMAFNADRHSRVWDEYSARRAEFDRLSGDQDVVSRVMRDSPDFLPFPDEWAWSYKWGPVRGERARLHAPPDEASVAVFHGKPKPHAVKDQWVLANWR